MNFNKKIGLFTFFFYMFLLSSCVSKTVDESRDYSVVEFSTEKDEVVNLRKLAGVKGLVLIAHRSECPIVRKYTSVVEALRPELEKSGVNVVYVNSEDWSEPAIVAKHKVSYQVKTVILKDLKEQLKAQFGVKRTSEVVFLDSELKRVLYQGAIDDRFEYEESRPVQNNYLRDAVSSYTNGQKIKISKTKSLGCLLN